MNKSYMMKINVNGMTEGERKARVINVRENVPSDFLLLSEKSLEEYGLAIARNRVKVKQLNFVEIYEVIEIDGKAYVAEDAETLKKETK